MDGAIDKINYQIRLLVSTTLKSGVQPESLEDELYVGTASGFDSAKLLEFILSIEDQFGLIIPDEDLILDNFDSISKITTYVLAKAQKPPSE
jgi:acyl carrier protein